MNNPINQRTLGIEAEQTVASVLQKQGWKILTTNYSTRRGEIDIVGLEGNALVFIEVKSSTLTDILLAGKVNGIKQRRLICAAKSYLQSIDTSSFSEVRFDVFLAVRSDSGGWRLNHIRNAFDLNEIEE